MCYYLQRSISFQYDLYTVLKWIHYSWTFSQWLQQDSATLHADFPWNLTYREINIPLSAYLWGILKEWLYQNPVAYDTIQLKHNNNTMYHVGGCLLKFSQKWPHTIPSFSHIAIWTKIMHNGKVKVKLFMCLTKYHAMKIFWGMNIHLHELSISALDGGEWPAS